MNDRNKDIGVKITQMLHSNEQKMFSQLFQTISLNRISRNPKLVR